jgi:hypothetical protein
MSGIATAVVAGSVITGYMASSAQEDAANTAANAQGQASAASIAEQRRQFDAVQKLLAPYVNAGSGSLTAQQNLLGLNGNQAQQDAINDIAGSAQFNTIAKQGEDAMLQNASATGGLRGGNIQGALAQYRPQLLNQLIQQQFSNLGGITSLGQNAAAGTGNAGMQSANAISAALQQQGAATAGAALASGNAQAQAWGGVGQAIGNVAMLKAMKVF